MKKSLQLRNMTLTVKVNLAKDQNVNIRKTMLRGKK